MPNTSVMVLTVVDWIACVETLKTMYLSKELNNVHFNLSH